MTTEIKQLIDSWNEGLPCTLISMGGLGDGYERCIWTLVMAILVDEHEGWDGGPAEFSPEYTKFWQDFGEDS